MDEHRITELLQMKSAEVPAKTRFCPDDEQIPKYFEGVLNRQAHATLKRHLVDCRFCQARVGNLERLEHDSPDLAVTGAMLADAKRLVKPASPKKPRSAPAWAAAAIVVLAIAVVTLQGPRPGNDPGAMTPDLQPSPESPRQLRSSNPSVYAPRITSPLEGDSIEPGHLKIRWTEVQDSLHYDVRIVSSEGFVVWNHRVEGTEWTLSVDQPLEPGVDYFVRVDAYLAIADSVSSDHIQFTMEKSKP